MSHRVRESAAMPRDRHGNAVALAARCVHFSARPADSILRMNTGGARWRELDGPTFWILATLLAGYFDYRVLATHAIAMQVLLFAIILFCCWQMSVSYDQLLEGPTVAAAAAFLEQTSLSAPGQGRLLLFGGVLGGFLIRTGLRLR